MLPRLSLFTARFYRDVLEHATKYLSLPFALI